MTLRASGYRAMLVGALAGTATVVAPFALASGAPSAKAACEIRALPTPEGTQAATVDGSTPDGRTLVGYATIQLNPVDGAAMVWRDGKIVQTIDDAPSAMVDMNSKGEGVGTDRDDANKAHAWVYRDGAVKELPGEGTAHAIGESGEVVGSRLEPTPNGPPIAVPVKWQPDGKMVDLPRDNETGEALDISADGTIVGKLGSQAYVWRPDGSHGPLRLPDGVPGDAQASATRINGPWVIGTANGSVRWNLRDGTAESVPELRFSITGVNDQGWTVGTGNNAGGLALVDGKPVELAPHHSLRATTPASISDDGKTFGGTVYDRPPMSERPVTWVCP